jgi:hypothetical protein
MPYADLVAVSCPAISMAIGAGFDRIGPIDGIAERFLFSTWPMAFVGSLLGLVVMAST